MLELETENGEMKTLIEQMTREVQMLKDQTTNKQKQDAQANELDQSEQVYELRRENFRLAADLRRIQLDNELLRASDGNANKDFAQFQEVAKLENSIEDLKSEKANSERENTKLLAKIRIMDGQITSLKKERERLLEISSDLKVQVSLSEKRKTYDYNTAPQTDRG